MTKNLPVYELKIDDVESYVDFISIVEHPAIEKDFIAFSKEQPVHFNFNDEKMELIGAAMIPDQLIYRKNADGIEFQVFFTKETIRKVAQSFFKNGFQSNLNIEHSDVTADSYVFQSFIVDSEKAISFMDLPDGSWVVGVKVNNPNIWKEIKEGKRKGFSIEGFFSMVDSSVYSKEESELIEILKSIQNKLKSKKI